MANDNKIHGFPQKKRTRLLVFGGTLLVVAIVAVVVAILVFGQKKQSDTKITFPDLTANHADYEAAVAMVGYGLLEVSSDGSFRPEQEVTRAEFAQLLNDVFQLSENQPIKPYFTDVLPDHPKYIAIEASRKLFGYTAEQESVASHTSQANQSEQSGQTFFPDQPVTCRDAAAATALALKLNPISNAEALADYLSLAKKDPIRAAGDKPLTRLDAARLLQRLINIRLPSPAPTFKIEGVR